MVFCYITCLIGAGFAAFLVFCEMYENGLEKTIKGISATAAVFIILLSILTYAVTTLWNTDLERRIATYEASKRTYEAAMVNDSLSGFERIELTKLMAEENKWLAREKATNWRWWRFGIYRGHREKLDMLEEIS